VAGNRAWVTAVEGGGGWKKPLGSQVKNERGGKRAYKKMLAKRGGGGGNPSFNRWKTGVGALRPSAARGWRGYEHSQDGAEKRKARFGGGGGDSISFVVKDVDLLKTHRGTFNEGGTGGSVWSETQVGYLTRGRFT